MQRSKKPVASDRELVAQKIAEMSLDQVIKLLVFMDRLEKENKVSNLATQRTVNAGGNR